MDILSALPALSEFTDTILTVTIAIMTALGYFARRGSPPPPSASAIGADLEAMLEEVPDAAEPAGEDATVPNPAPAKQRAARAAATELVVRQHRRLLAAFIAQDPVSIARYQLRLRAFGLPAPETEQECAAALRLLTPTEETP